MAPDVLMQLAVEKCREGLARGQSPFGCAIALEEEVIAVAHNTVSLTTDITAHAEVNAVRAGCQHTGEIFLAGATVATTCEPCPMCMAALHWARVETVYYGAGISDAKRAGFNELQVPASELIRIGGSKLQLEGGVLRDECRELFDQWLANPDRTVY